MAADHDPLGYYRVLGLAPNATQVQIQHAYREWAKAYHPDTSGKSDSSDFLKIKDAYDTLNDVTRRADYARLAREAATHETPVESGLDDLYTQQAAVQPEDNTPQAIHCSRCGTIPAQPRYCIFSRVLSLIVYARVSHQDGTLCPRCAAGRSLRASAVCWLCGWWSVVGLIETPAALWKNFRLGEKPRHVNARLLISQARYFLSVKDQALARSCLAQAERFDEGENAAILAALKAVIRPGGAQKIKDEWSLNRKRDVLGHSLPVVVMVAALTSFGLRSFLLPVEHTLGPVTAAAPTVQPESVSPPHLPDIRHVVALSAAVWSRDDSGQEIARDHLPQFTTVEVLGATDNPDFVLARLPDGRSGTVAMANLAVGDGTAAKLKWCRPQPEPSPPNGEVFRQPPSGANRVVVTNNSGDEVVAKFRDPTGAAVAALFIAGHAQASLENFGDGTYQLEFATGSGWSRRCGIFTKDMNAQRLLKADTYASWAAVEPQGGRLKVVIHSKPTVYILPLAETERLQARSIDEGSFSRN